MSYLRFQRLEQQSGRKTAVWAVLATRDGSKLGEVRWFGRWRQYAFFPEPGTTFNADCLIGLADFTKVQTIVHRNAGRAQSAVRRPQ